MRPKTDIPLVAAAAAMKVGYNVALRLVLRGELPGRQNGSGRWLVDASAVARWCERNASSSPVEQYADTHDGHAITMPMQGTIV